jgi:hypothetical protein
MAPLLGASVSDIYGSNFGLTAEQIAAKTLSENQKLANVNKNYQEELKEKEIAGTPNFKEQYSPEIFGNSYNSNNISNIKMPPNPAPKSINNTQFAKRLAWTNPQNTWPSSNGFSMFNRFQDLFGTRENFTEHMTTDSECIHKLVSLVKELLLICKIIMFVLILLFVIKVLEKKN